MPKQIILLIDYDPENIESTMGPLAEAGYEVEVAQDGQAGIEAFRRLQPDLVLIEPMVPKKHGFEVCQEIKASEDGRGTPVLITTGFYRGRKHQQEAKQYYGCDEYLERPIDPDTLLETCRRYLVEEVLQPEVIEELESTIDEPQQVKGTLPALEDLSEDEIMARLDELIIEEPTSESTEPAEEPAKASAEIQAEEPVDALVEPPAALQEKEEPEEVAAPVAERAVEQKPIEAAPFTEEAVTAEPRQKSRRWIFAAAAVLVLALLGATAIVFVPRLTGSESVGDSAGESGPVASAGFTAPVRRAPAAAVVERNWQVGPPAAVTPGSEPEDFRLSFAHELIRETPPTESVPAKANVPDDRLRGNKPAAETPSAPAPKRETRLAAANPKPETRASAPATAPAPRLQPQPQPQPSMERQPEDNDSMNTASVAPAVTAATQLPAEEQAEEPPVETPTEVEPEPEPEPEVKTQPTFDMPTPEAPRLTAGTLLDLDEVDAAPEPLEKRAPAYPPMARKLRLSGIVRLRLLVNERGVVDDVEVLAGSPGGLLEKSAVKGAHGWTYTPATKDGVPVKVWVFERVDFRR